MRFLKNVLGNPDFDEVQQAYSKYYEYLDSIKGKMPVNARNFATASWHYNPEDSRCPHDSWLESLAINEISSGERSEIRHIEIRVILLGAYHDGYIELLYRDVSKYVFEKKAKHIGIPPLVNVGHGDWHIDEFSLTEDADVVHDIIFSTGAQWSIECKDVIYDWRNKEGA